MATLVERLVGAVIVPSSASSPSPAEHSQPLDATTPFSRALMDDVLDATFGYWIEGMLGETSGQSLDQLLREAVRHVLEDALAEMEQAIGDAFTGLDRDAVQGALEDALLEAIDDVLGQRGGSPDADSGATCAEPAMAGDATAAVMVALALPTMLRASTTQAMAAADAITGLASRAHDGASSSAVPAPSSVATLDSSTQRGGGFHKLSRAVTPLTDVAPPSPAKAMQGGAGASGGGAGGTALVAVPASHDLPDLTGGRVGADDPSRIPESIPQDCIAHPN